MRTTKFSDDFFTGQRIVNIMCDRSEPLISDINKKIFEPGCGTGNFLIEILRRRLIKLESTQDSQMKALVALSNLYGADLRSEYIDITRQRLRSAIQGYYGEHSLDYRFWPLVDLFLRRNLCTFDVTDQQKIHHFPDWHPVSSFKFIDINKHIKPSS